MNSTSDERRFTVNSFTAEPAPEGGTQAVAELRLGGRSTRLTFRSSDAALVPRPEAAAAALLVPAMGAGASLHVPGTPAEYFAPNLATMQDAFATWVPELTHVPVVFGEDESDESAEPPAGRRTATFFSGGVDSFYTLLKHRDDIDVLVFVHGLDVSLDDHALREEVSKRLRSVATALGKELIEVETNFRQVHDRPSVSRRFHNWELMHGAALASVAYLLSDVVSVCYVPATHTFDGVRPWGSSPVIDPLWTSRRLLFVHDGCEADRLQKCARLAESPVALDHLRVCWKNPNGAYNCGRCEKCVRTQLSLLAVDTLDRCATFESSIDLRAVRSLQIKAEWTRDYLRTVASRLSTQGGHAAIVRALRIALARSKLQYELLAGPIDWLRTRRKASRHDRR